jgi:hypothetical protein
LRALGPLISVLTSIAAFGVCSHVRAEVRARELKMEIPFVYSLSAAVKDAFLGHRVSDETLESPNSNLRMIFVADGAKTEGRSDAELRAEAKRFSEFAYFWLKVQPENFVLHSATLERMSAAYSDLEDYSTVISARDELVLRDRPHDFAGIMKVSYLDPARAEGVFARFGVASGSIVYPQSLEEGKPYRIWDPLTGEWTEHAVDPVLRAQGPVVKISQVIGRRQDMFPSMLLAATIDLARRAQHEDFRLPSGFVLECPSNRIGTYHQLGFRLLSKTPSAEGSFLMGLGPAGFAGIAVPHSHRHILKVLRDSGFGLSGDYRPDGAPIRKWAHDTRTTLAERFAHKKERILRKLLPWRAKRKAR